MQIVTKHVDHLIDNMAKVAEAVKLEEHPLDASIRGSISFEEVVCEQPGRLSSILKLNDIEFSEGFSFYLQDKGDCFFNFKKVAGCIYKLSYTSTHNLDCDVLRPFACVMTDVYRRRHQVLDKLQKELERYENYYVLNVQDNPSRLVINHDSFTIEDYFAIKVTKEIRTPAKQLVAA